ncbi:hypothetical protein [Acidovorax sp. NCPPB 4044]|uniref:hypothetical protein n=1 Tax=Acidovorax sp. NCPPB 4044 TaxID=2940490 RepID=UPI002303082B|nr:hypothetical protein [Acidovorax sp. NCPPB 4044]MDA8520206.1 hypothetical protein [Acidovorax sp. NCPPB 4044]
MAGALSAGNAPMRAALSGIGTSIDTHRAHPEIDPEKHAKNRQIELAMSLHGRRAIYLDLKFWIGMRDAEASGHAPHPCSALLAALRKAVAAGHAFCPISDSCFIEVFKQSDPNTRRRTAALIDALSLGVTITAQDLRIGTEIAHLLHALTPDEVHPLDHLVWSKLSYTLGYLRPPVGMFDALTGRAIEKAFFDHMWNIPLIEIEQNSGDALSAHHPEHHERLAQTLNQGIAKHAAGIKSFKQVYEHELGGAMELYAGRAADIMCSMSSASLAPRPAKGSTEYKTIERQCLGLLVGPMDTDKGKATLRTLNIKTSIHAAVRWNKGQKFKANDLFDMRHAAAAVGYCDAFLTERSLANVLTRSDLALDKLYDCNVVSTPEAALKYVQAVT